MGRQISAAQRAPQLQPRMQEDSAMPKGERAIPEEEIHRQIAEAAYYRAAERGFAPGRELEDWLEAEAEIAKASGMRADVN
jgi:hypothetical protein